MKNKVILESENTPMGIFQKERTDAISEMFDSEDDDGIYPTTAFFIRLDNCVRKLLRAKHELAFHPDYLKFNEGVEAGRTLERAKLERTPRTDLENKLADEEFIQRVHLMDEEMTAVIKKLKIVEPIWDSEKGEWVHGELWQRHNAIAQAATNKVLNDPDVVLIDRERKLPNAPMPCPEPIPNDVYFYRGYERAKEDYAGYLPVILLAGEKEVEE